MLSAECRRDEGTRKETEDVKKRRNSHGAIDVYKKKRKRNQTETDTKRELQRRPESLIQDTHKAFIT